MLAVIVDVSVNHLRHRSEKDNYEQAQKLTNTKGYVPEYYDEAAFVRAISQKLSPEEVRLVVNPLTITSEMKRWADTLTSSATNDSSRAKMLFNAFVDHVQKSQPLTTGEVRTAREVFAVWETHGASLYCKDYALLYVVLARAVGIKAFDVYVTEAADGQRVSHDCAAVLLDGKIVLVDPLSGLFGASHKEFILLDDVQSAGLYMSQLSDMKSSEIACKLAPTLGLVQLNLFEKLAANNDIRKARQVLLTVEWLDTNPATRDYIEARIALLEGKSESATSLLSKAIELNPNEATYHTFLAEAYAQEGRVPEARKEFQRALCCPIAINEAEKLQNFIDNTNELVAWGYYLRGRAMQNQGNSNGAWINFNKAIELKPELRKTGVSP